MRLLTRIGRRIATIAVVVATAATALTTPASAAVTYWKFKNVEKNKCLTAGSSGVAYLAGCESGNPYQLWDWVDSSDTYKLLKNKQTKRCLVTEITGAPSSVWTAGCNSGARGQLWNNGNGYIAVIWGSWLRSSPASAAGVYTADDWYTMSEWHEWDSWVP